MLATFDDLVAIGAIPDNTTSYTKYGVRATRLLELASGQVCAYVGMTEAALTVALSPDQMTALAAVTAECAGSRLNVSAAPSTDPYGTVDGIASVMLNRWHKSQIDMIVGNTLTAGAARGSRSVVSDRDPDSSLLTTGVTSDYLTVNGPNVEWPFL
jgi:hypothetical protein